MKERGRTTTFFFKGTSILSFENFIDISGRQGNTHPFQQFTPPMTATAGVEPGCSQEPEIPSGSPMWVEETQVFVLSPAFCPRTH